MRIVRFLLQKEFLQIFRNRGMLPIIFVLPVIQLVVLSYAATYELREVKFHLVDMDRSTLSSRLVKKFQATGYFTLVEESFSVDEGINSLRSNNTGMVFHIPPDFEQSTGSAGRGEANVQFIIDAVDGTTAGLIQGYAQSILQDFSNQIVADFQTVDHSAAAPGISVNPASWYNPNLDYINYMVPGILVVLVSMIGMFLSGMNIVREREIGTIEQLNVTPIKRYQFMIGKLLPFWIIAMFELAIGLVIARFGFNIPFEGSVFIIFAIAGVYLVVVEGIGLFISTVTNTQQQAMFIAWFLMVVFILMGGLFTPIESMPVWAQKLTLVNPVAYFIEIMRMVLLKGAGIGDVLDLVAALVIMVLVILPAAVLRYRKSTV